jgi:citrate synthase
MSTAKPAGSPKSAPKMAEERLQDASAWWSTSIIDIQPGHFGVRGDAIQDVMGRVRVPDIVWLMVGGVLPMPAD